MKHFALASKSVEDHRLPNVSDLDLRLAKTGKLRGDSALVLSAEMFNLLNSGTVLGSNAEATSQVFGQIQATLNPRIVRFGARLAFQEGSGGSSADEFVTDFESVVDRPRPLVTREEGGARVARRRGDECIVHATTGEAFPRACPEEFEVRRRRQHQG